MRRFAWLSRAFVVTVIMLTALAPRWVALRSPLLVDRGDALDVVLVSVGFEPAVVERHGTSNLGVADASRRFLLAAPMLLAVLALLAAVEARLSRALVAARARPGVSPAVALPPRRGPPLIAA